MNRILPICVLDTNVIYPLWIRDLLLWFAYHDLYTPRWSKHIFDEWIHVMKRKGISDLEISKRTTIVNKAFPNALVLGYETLIETLLLPDEKDRHVLAAAIKSKANLIITNNLKDFPVDLLSCYGLVAKNADHFLSDSIDLNPIVSGRAFRDLLQAKRNPAIDEYVVLDILKRNRLRKTAESFQSLI